LKELRMSTNYIKWHTHESLEKIASEIHKKYRCNVPVDIDYIVEMMGIELFDISRLKEDFGIYGFLGRVQGRYVIYVQKGAFDATNYNTTLTIAEELTHYILQKKYFKDVKDIEGAYSFYADISEKSKSMMEFNAKYLAGAILVPADILREEATNLVKENKDVLFSLLKEDFNEMIDTLSSKLRDVFQVPENAISYRLRTRIIGFKEFLKKEYCEWKKNSL